MTHPRQPLHPSSACKVAARALAAQGQYGIVTDLAREHGLPRQRVYAVREQARVAWEATFTRPRPRQSGGFTLEMTHADMLRAVVGLRVITPASVRDIVEALPVLYGRRWSYGKVWNVLQEAEQRAAAVLEQVDLSRIESVALDEMFSQGRPVLAGIDLDTQYLFQLEVRGGRSGDDWAESLGKLRDRQGLNPKRVVKDAGTGLRAGVRACWPAIDEHDDLFHAVYMMGKEAYHLERGAYRSLNAVDELVRRCSRARTDADREPLDQQLNAAHIRMDEAIERYDRFEALRREAGQALELTDRGSGRLRTSAEVVDVLGRVAAEMTRLDGKRIRKVATYIGNRAEGLGKYLNGLAARLAAVTEEAGGEEVVRATTRAYQANLQVSQGGPPWDRRARRLELVDATRALVDITGRHPERLKRAIGAVMPELVHRHRASSAIENLNSVLRPYLVVQKHAEQGFLNLFRFHQNTRTRQWGRWKGTSAHEAVTGVKVDDWLSLLGFPPGEAFAAAA